MASSILPISTLDVTRSRSGGGAPPARSLSIRTFDSEAPPLVPKRGELEWNPSIHGRYSMESISPSVPPSPSTSTSNLLLPSTPPHSPSVGSPEAASVRPRPPCTPHHILIPSIHFSISILSIVIYSILWFFANKKLAAAGLNGLIEGSLQVLLLLVLAFLFYILWHKGKALYLPLRRRHLDKDPSLQPVDGEDEKAYSPRGGWCKLSERALRLKPAVIRPKVPAPAYQPGPVASISTMERDIATALQRSEDGVADPLDINVAIERARNGGVAPMYGSVEMSSTSVLERGASVRRRTLSIGTSLAAVLRAGEMRRSLHLPS